LQRPEMLFFFGGRLNQAECADAGVSDTIVVIYRKRSNHPISTECQARLAA
jgi:hypothetical protein